MFFSICGSFSFLCCFLPHTLYSVRDMCTQHREPEKSRKFMNQHGNWISYYLLPTPLLCTSDFWLVTVFVPFLEETGLKLLYCSEVNLHKNLLWYLWPRSSHLIVVSSCHSFKLPLALLFQWHLFYPVCAETLSSVKRGFMTTAIQGLHTVKQDNNFTWDMGLVSCFKHRLSPI